MGLMKRCLRRIGGINAMILILYTVFVFVSHAFVVCSYDNRAFQMVGRAFFSVAIVSVIVCPMALDRVKKAYIRPDDGLKTVEGKRKRFAQVYAGVFLFLLAAYLVHYPGGFGADSLAQYRQAVENAYNDWHPYVHTLFAFKLPLTLTGGWIGSIVLFQILLLSAAVAYAVITIAEYTNRKFAAFTLLFYLLNPNTVPLALSPLKDTSFSIAALLLTAFALRIHLTDGKWIAHRGNAIAFSAILAAATLLRHNAVLFTLPLLAAVWLCVSRTYKVVITVLAMGLVLLFRGPVFQMLEVEKPGMRNSETLGLPLNIIASVAAYHPEALDEKTRELVDLIAPQETWENHYSYGNFNRFKYDHRVNLAPIEEYKAIEIIKMALNCIARSPKEAISGAIRVTDPVYTLTDDYSGVIEVEIAENEFGIRHGFGAAIRKGYRFCAQLISMGFAYAVHYIGAVMLALLTVILAKCSLKDRNDWKRIILAVPMFSYNFGTMLLMTHRGDAQRFFHYSFFLIPLYLVLFCRKDARRA